MCKTLTNYLIMIKPAKELLERTLINHKTVKSEMAQKYNSHSGSVMNDCISTCGWSKILSAAKYSCSPNFIDA